MAEWLGSALQKLLQRFESASDLIVKMESPVVTATAGLLLLRVPTRVPTDDDKLASWPENARVVSQPIFQENRFGDP